MVLCVATLDQTFLQSLRLLLALKSYLNVVPHPLYFGQDALQLIQDGQCLWLGVFIEDNFAINFLHGSQNNGAGVLVPILRVHTLLADYIGDIKLQFL